MLKIIDTPEKFVVKFNYDFCKQRYLPFRSVEGALTSGTIKLRELATCYDYETIQLWLESWLYTTSMYMDFQLNEQQAKETAQSLTEELYMLNLTEITLFFRKLNKGDYGIFYGKFNMQTIIKGAKEYRMQRGQVLVNLTTEQQKLLE